jgi:hypothetical protein
MSEIDDWLKRHEGERAANLAYTLMRVVINHVNATYSGTSNQTRVELLETMRKTIGDCVEEQ